MFKTRFSLRVLKRTLDECSKSLTSSTCTRVRMESYSIRASCYFKLAEFEKAESDAKQAFSLATKILKESPRCSDAIFYCALALYICGKFGQSEERLVQLLKLCPQHRNGRRLLEDIRRLDSDDDELTAVPDPMQQYWRVLGLKPEFTREDLNKAHRKWSLKYHPDKHPGVSEAENRRLTEKCAEINAARDAIRTHMNWY